MNAGQKPELVIAYCHSIFELRYKLRRMFQVKLKEAGISISFEVLEIMKHLQNRDGLNQQDLADMLFKDKSSMTYLIDNMVKAGLVSRKEDEADRRNKLIILSPKAYELLKQLEPLASHCYAVLAENVEDKELRSALQMVARMTGSLDAFIG